MKNIVGIVTLIIFISTTIAFSQNYSLKDSSWQEIYFSNDSVLSYWSVEQKLSGGKCSTIRNELHRYNLIGEARKLPFSALLSICMGFTMIGDSEHLIYNLSKMQERLERKKIESYKNKKEIGIRERKIIYTKPAYGPYAVLFNVFILIIFGCWEIGKRYSTSEQNGSRKIINWVYTISVPLSTAIMFYNVVDWQQSKSVPSILSSMALYYFEIDLPQINDALFVISGVIFLVSSVALGCMLLGKLGHFFLGIFILVIEMFVFWLVLRGGGVLLEEIIYYFTSFLIFGFSVFIIRKHRLYYDVKTTKSEPEMVLIET